MDLGYPGDDTGDNISALNCYYSELTGFYWIWKNYHEADYVGTCHYRRYLLNEREQIFTEAEYRGLLENYDLVTTKRVCLNNSYHEGFSANHNRKALDMTGEVIKELYPEGLHKLTEHTIDEFDTLFGQMEEIRRTGYSFEKEESNKDVQCIAVPVKYKEHVIAGMSVAVPVFYYSEEFEKKAMEELKKAKRHIEKLIQDNTQEWVYSPLGAEM